MNTALATVLTTTYHDIPETIRPPAATPRALPTASPTSLVIEVDAHKTSGTRCSELLHIFTTGRLEVMRLLVASSSRSNLMCARD